MNSLLEDEELMPGTVSCKIGSDSLAEFGLGSFVVASHPPEPVDSNVSMPACMWIGQNNSDGKCLITSLPMKNGIDCISVAPVTTIFNSYRSTDCSNSLPRPDKNCGSTKESIQGDSLASAKTSLSQVSSISGFSDDSNWSNTTDGANKPHKENDPRWKAICAIRARVGVLGAKHFRLLNRLGSGDIGSVYLSELIPTRYVFAIKVMDKASLARRNKFGRAMMEKEILQLVDHPFLPTLYTHFETDRFSCLVMEYCPGGDLYTLRQWQPKKRFSEHSARFYAAEVLLALEYLHMVGVVYRDLKPENVLVRADGHIMLSDFDLSLRCAVSPKVITNSRNHNPSKPRDASCLQPSCTLFQPGCIQPGWFFSQKFKKKSIMSQADTNPRIPSTALPEVVVEPTLVRSMSFVGTHEYLAPEIKGEGHGSAVDWWTFGIFLHELLYGKTPFKGSRNRMTLYNVVEKSLKFPRSPATSYTSRDLIARLLAKEPEARLGVKRGAAEIKQHPFFEGVNWALIRCSMPPEVPGPVEAKLPEPYGEAGPVGRSKGNETARPLSGGKYLDFEFF